MRNIFDENWIRVADPDGDYLDPDPTPEKETDPAFEKESLRDSDLPKNRIRIRAFPNSESDPKTRIHNPGSDKNVTIRPRKPTDKTFQRIAILQTAEELTSLR